MPIVFAAITPHPPILIPEIGKDYLKKLEKTKEAMEKLEQDLYVSKPDSIIIISPHGDVLADSFSINLNANYTANFKEFGNYELELNFKSDYMTIQKIRAANESGQSSPLVLTSNEELDHGFSIPLYYLMRHLKNVPIIPITYSALDYPQHYIFGQFLHRQLSKIDKRFAIIASGDLSHRLTKDAPGGYTPKGKVLDKKIIDAVENKNADELINIDPKLVAEGAECGLRSIITLLGIIKFFEYKPEIYSYEGPLGIGYMVCNMHLA